MTKKEKTALNIKLKRSKKAIKQLNSTNKPKAASHKTFSVELIFDNKDAADSFFAYWLDGGGDGGGNIRWDTDEWCNKHKWMRIVGDGIPLVF